MARTRLQLNETLTNLMVEFDESYKKDHVYNIPPSKGMNYPCIVYKLNRVNALYADNNKYLRRNQYSITLIDPNPDSPIKEAILALQYCSFDREFETSGLTHTVFTLYY